MKKIMLVIVIATAMLTISSPSIAQRYYVKVRPTVVVKARPVAPAPTHIWVEPAYVWRNGNYVLVDGYWVAPRPGYRYVQGRWRNGPRGYYWRPGRWRK